VFAKTRRHPPPGAFSTEAAGLRWLAEADAPGLRVAEVLAVDDGDPADPARPALLVLAWIEPGRASRTTAEALGRGLAALHAAGAPAFGRADRRTTGGLALPNEPCATWASFYATQRLLPLARIAHDRGALAPAAVAGLEHVAAHLERWGAADEGPARLHGDLWGGNLVVGAGGTPWLVDPAAHGGHREFDLAMMRLFGGFEPATFAAYAEAHPLAEGAAQRTTLHQLAPLVVHAIKFGGGYVGAASRAIASCR
jgi:fructosamine-3-kinase